MALRYEVAVDEPVIEEPILPVEEDDDDENDEDDDDEDDEDDDEDDDEPEQLELPFNDSPVQP